MKNLASLWVVGGAFASFAALANPEFGPMSGSSWDRLGYVLKTANGGLKAAVVEVGDYWVERPDGKCDVTRIRLADPVGWNKEMPLHSAPAVTSTTAVEACPAQRFVITN